MIRAHIASLLASTAPLMAPANEGAGSLPKPGTAPETTVETGSGQSGFAGSISMDIDGDKVTVSDQESTNDHIEVGDGAVNGAPPKDDDQQQQDGTDTDQQTDGEGDDQDQQADDAPAELPAFKADDPEALKAYEDTFKVGGKLNMSALSSEWWSHAQAAEDGVGHLSDDTYAYLDHLGIPKEMVQIAEQGQQALNDKKEGALVARAGGKANLDKAISWAVKSKGYTPEQRAAFNEAVAAGGAKAADAIDLLMTRHDKASGRRANPGKTLGENTGHGGGGGSKQAETYASKEEWLAARADAGRDMNKQAEVSRKMRRSPGALHW